MCVQAYEECAVAQRTKQAHFVELSTAPTLCISDELKKCVEHDNGDGILKDHIGDHIVQVVVSEYRCASRD